MSREILTLSREVSELATKKIGEIQRVTATTQQLTRALSIDSNGRVIAADSGKGVLTESFMLRHAGQKSGSYTDQAGNLIGFALTPGYETYRGLGWYGVMVRSGAHG